MEKKFNLAKEIIIGFFLAAIICAIICVAINFYLVKMPDSESANTINHAISGFMSGGISAIISTVITAKKIMNQRG